MALAFSPRMVPNGASALPRRVDGAPSWVRRVCEPRAPRVVDRRRVGARLETLGLVLAGLALPCLARQVPLSSPIEWLRASLTSDGSSARRVLGGWAVRLFWDSPACPTAAGFGLEPYALALGAGSALALVVSAVRRRPLRGGGQGLVALALLGALGLKVAPWTGIHWTSLALGAWATLALVAASVVVARRARVSVTCLGLGLGLVAHEVGAILLWGPAADPWVYRHAAVAALCALALVGGGCWLARRHRVAECDLSGLLSACAAPADVALLPWAWFRLGQWALERSVAWTREVTWGLGCYDLRLALESPGGRCATDAALAAAAVAALALVLRARDRLDRGLAGIA